jgi:hypothetical protein
MVKTCLSPYIWDNWNKWTDDSNTIDFKVPKSKNKPDNPVGECSVPEPETEGTTGVGNGEAKLSMELKGISEPLGGSNDPTDIKDIDPKTGRNVNGFGYISVKEFSSGSKDLRLGVHVSTQYLGFLSGFWFGVRGWLFECYYQTTLQYEYIQNNEKYQEYLSEIRLYEDLNEIDTIRRILFDLNGGFILDATIMSGEICFSKMDRYKEFIFAVEKYVDKKREQFRKARIFHNNEFYEGNRTQFLPLNVPDSYYGLLLEDFETPVPNYILHSTFRQLLIAVEMFSSDIPKSISFLDKIAKNEALGGKELCDEVQVERHASYKREVFKPVLIFVNESCGYFPVGSETYDDIICERISQNKPKLGVKRDSRIRTTCENFSGKRKKSSSKSPMLSASNSPYQPSQPSQKKGKQNKGT